MIIAASSVGTLIEWYDPVSPDDALFCSISAAILL